MPILQDEIWRKTQKLLAAGRMRSTLFGYSFIICFCEYLIAIALGLIVIPVVEIVKLIQRAIHKNK